MKTIKQLTVFLENKKGRLTQVTEVLEKSKIDISAFSVADSSEYGLLRMIVNKPDRAYEALKAEHLAVKITEVIALIIPHEHGSLHRILEILTEADVQIEYMYAFAFKNNATVVIRTSNIEKTITVLQEQKHQLLEAQDIDD